MAGRLSATVRAAETVGRLATTHGPLVFHQSGGCCDGSSPMCLPAGELPPAPGDTLLGEIAGLPFYVDADQDRRWGHPEILVDVRPGAATSLSLEGAEDLHFISRVSPDATVTG
jgi:uncharacterized protein (DUF779 family)